MHIILKHIELSTGLLVNSILSTSSEVKLSERRKSSKEYKRIHKELKDNRSAAVSMYEPKVEVKLEGEN